MSKKVEYVPDSLVVRRRAVLARVWQFLETLPEISEYSETAPTDDTAEEFNALSESNDLPQPNANGMQTLISRDDHQLATELGNDLHSSRMT